MHPPGYSKDSCLPLQNTSTISYCILRFDKTISVFNIYNRCTFL